MATQADVAAHLFMSRQNASELFGRGILPDRGRAGADLDECRRAYIEHIRAQAAGRVGSGDGELDLTEERARKAKEEADRLEMLNAQTRGELLARADVDAAVIGAFARVRARMIGVPSKVAPVVVTMDTPAEAEAAIRKAIYEALKELADTSVAQLCGDDGGVVEDTESTA
jgi:terminase small subunit / prophage DNA-packing protein